MTKRTDIEEKIKGLSKEQRQDLYDALSLMADVDKLPVDDSDVLDAITNLQKDVAGLKGLFNPAPADILPVTQAKEKGIWEWIDKLI